jgi:hypothetical protein
MGKVGGPEGVMVVVVPVAAPPGIRKLVGNSISRRGMTGGKRYNLNRQNNVDLIVNLKKSVCSKTLYVYINERRKETHWDLPVGKQQAVIRVLVHQSLRRTTYLFHHPLEGLKTL